MKNKKQQISYKKTRIKFDYDLGDARTLLDAVVFKRNAFCRNASIDASWNSLASTDRTPCRSDGNI